MTEHDRTTTERPREIPVPEGTKSCSPQGRPALVVDLTGWEEINILDLSLLLTAQQHAQEEDRDVWLAGVPFHIWRALHEMGLGKYFRPFPVSGELEV